MVECKAYDQKIVGLNLTAAVCQGAELGKKGKYMGLSMAMAPWRSIPDSCFALVNLKLQRYRVMELQSIDRRLWNTVCGAYTWTVQSYLTWNCTKHNFFSLKCLKYTQWTFCLVYFFFNFYLLSNNILLITLLHFLEHLKYIWMYNCLCIWQ